MRRVKDFVLAIALFWLGNQICRETRRPSAGQNEANRIQPSPMPERVDVVNAGWHSQEAEHHSKEQKFWNRTLLLYLATFAATAAASVFAYGAYSQAKRQADLADQSLFSATRPWLEPSQVVVHDLFVFGDELVTNLQVKFRNVGHSPAKNIIPKGIINASSMTVKSVTDECLSGEFDRKNTYHVLFQEQDGIANLNLHLKNINDIVRKTGNLQALNVGICLNYYFEGSEIEHYTSVMATLTRSRDASEEGDHAGNGINIASQGARNPSSVDATILDVGTVAN